MLQPTAFGADIPADMIEHQRAQGQSERDRRAPPFPLFISELSIVQCQTGAALAPLNRAFLVSEAVGALVGFGGGGALVLLRWGVMMIVGYVRDFANFPFDSRTLTPAHKQRMMTGVGS